jgi:hypothetical protein
MDTHTDLCIHDLTRAHCADCTPVPSFGDAETIKVSDLAVGDYLVKFPAQRGIRACEVGSGVATLAPSYRWIEQGRPRGPRFPIPATKITFIMAELVLDVPNSCDIIVRRPLAG